MTDKEEQPKQPIGERERQYHATTVWQAAMDYGSDRFPASPTEIAAVVRIALAMDKILLLFAEPSR